MLARIFALLPLWTVVAQPIAPAFTASSVLPANERTRRPLQPGMLVSVYGRHLGPDTPCTPPRGAVETRQLCDTTVTIAGFNADLLYVQANQINLRVPYAVPTAGLVPFVITHRGLASSVVSIRFALLAGRISLKGRAQVHMPIWIQVTLPGRYQQSLRYPITIYPHYFGGHIFEVRRNGKAVPGIQGPAVLPAPGGGAPGNIGGHGAIGLGLPHEPANTGRLPLHLAFRFDQPGRYEVRYTGYDFTFPASRRPLIRSTWLPMVVEPCSNAARLTWLDKMQKTAPSDPVELLTDYLPSILAWPDTHVLALIENAFYHENDLVRQYGVHSLRLFKASDVVAWLPDVLRRRGPAYDLVAYLLGVRRNLFQAFGPEIAEIALRYLKSASPLSTRGALQSLTFLRPHFDWSNSPQILSRMDAAVFDSAEAWIRRGSPDLLHALALYLGNLKTDRSRRLLWRLVDNGGSIREQALICLTWVGDARDRARLEKYRDLAGFAYHLDRTYGSQPRQY